MILPDGRKLRIPDWVLFPAVILLAILWAVIVGPDGLAGLAPNR